jgi:hypothetical protein
VAQGRSDRSTYLEMKLELMSATRFSAFQSNQLYVNEYPVGVLGRWGSMSAFVIRVDMGALGHAQCSGGTDGNLQSSPTAIVRVKGVPIEKKHIARTELVSEQGESFTRNITAA